MYANGKMIPVETIPGMMGQGDKGEWRRWWIQVWYYYKNICKCYHVPPPSTTIKVF
jgi:hypothetical protein